MPVANIVRRLLSTRKRCMRVSQTDFDPLRVVLTKSSLWDKSWSICTPSVGPQFLSFLIWKWRSTQSILQFCGAASRRKICQTNSFHISYIWTRISETEFVLTIFHPSSLRGVVLQIWSLPPFCFKCIVETVMETALSSYGIRLSSKLSDVESSSDLVLLDESPGKLQVFFSPIVWTLVYVCLGCFLPSKCKMLLHDQIGLKPNLVLVRWELSEIDRFN